MNYEMHDGSVMKNEEDSRIMEFLMDVKPHKHPVYTPDDIGTASLMCDVYNDSLRYCPNTGDWYIWDGSWVKHKESDLVSDKLQTLLNVLLYYCKEQEVLCGKEDVEKYYKYVRSARMNTRMKGITEVFKTTVSMYLNEMDKNPYILNTPRTAFNLKTNEIIENVRDYNITKKTTCNLPTFLDTTCTRWYQFIDEIMSGDKEKAAFLQRALGYSLLGVNREECMFIAYGAKTRNGKGTLFSTITSVLGSDYADSSSPDLICEGKNGKSTDFNAPQPALAKLVGTRIVSMSESKKEVRLDAASVKTITGRDMLTTRGLYQESFSFVPQFTLWLNTNHLPAVTDDTVFSSGRIHVIEFNEHFDEESQDKDLKEIFSLPENKPTILKWLVDGCHDYIKNGLNPPQCVREATANYRRMHDRLGCFIEECCIVDPTKKVQRGALYAKYTQWCMKPENKYRATGSTTFYNEIQSRGFPIRKSGEWIVEGIDIKPLQENGKINLT